MQQTSNPDTPSKRLKKVHKQLFVGRYTEKHYIESLKGYRDVISIHRDESIIPHLRDLQKDLLQEAAKRWVGITNDQDENTDGMLLWTQIDNVPVGKHWFQIRSVKLEDTEVQLRIQHIRPYEANESNFCKNDPNVTFDLQEILTFHNICSAFKFSTVVIMTLVTFAIETVKYLADYSIKVSYALQGLIHALTPTFLGIIDLVTKCVGGLYWLIYVLFKGTLKSNVKNVPEALQYRQSYSQYQSSPSQSKSRALPITMGTYNNAYKDTSQTWNSYNTRSRNSSARESWFQQ